MDENRRMDEAELQLVIFQLGKEDYALEVARVKEIIPVTGITRMPNAPGYLKGIINLRGQIIAVLDLAERLGIAADAEADRRIIVLDLEEVRAGVLVDNVLEVGRVPAGSLEPSPLAQGEAGAIKGVIQYASKLLILLDPAAILAGEAVESFVAHDAGSGTPPA
ncbi:MAG: chemotaxis protein CheW [Candidatus Geothermincolia bacterium]